MDLLIFAIVWLALLLFGIGYNALVAWLERQELDQGYTALLVAAGVLVTVLAGGFAAGWQAALIYLALFAASGSAMMVGSFLRHAEQVRREREYVERMAKEELDATSQARRIPDEM